MAVSAALLQLNEREKPLAREKKEERREISKGDEKHSREQQAKQEKKRKNREKHMNSNTKGFVICKFASN